MYQNIPQELRALNQWVVAGPDKCPINPRTGQAADPSNVGTCGTFEEAMHAGYKHVGFMLSRLDPFTIIDLDNPYERKDKITKVVTPILPGDADYAKAQEIAQRHSLIYRSFPSYTELSQSGKGVHIVIRGGVPAGMRRDKVEVYSEGRYMICTGNVLKNLPVEDCQAMLDTLITDMGRLITPLGELIEEDAIMTDAEVWRMATTAVNSEKFIDLCRGDWQKYAHEWKDQSQSEADFALCSMLCFYSRCNSQVVRMFRQTALGQREKAQRDQYLIGNRYGIIAKIRSREAPLINVASIPLAVPAPVIPPPVALPAPVPPPIPGLPPAVPVPPPVSHGLFPPGLVGEVANYILNSAIRPVPEIALGAAIAFCAGVCGRSYNISSNGLNQYVIILAESGRGKEGAATGIDALTTALKQRVPAVERFMGPSAFASGTALLRIVDQKPCFLSVMGEIGITLQTICNPHASDHNKLLKKVLLDLYGKSGFHKILRSSAYAQAENNTKLIQSPNISILGESTAENFYAALDLSNVTEGLVPRFSVVEYNGKRVRRNRKAFTPPDAALVDRLATLVTIAVRSEEMTTCAPVRMLKDAEALLDTFDEYADDVINETGNAAVTELWNRAHLKSLKLAALVAVGINPHEPTITADVATWAREFVRGEITSAMARFSSGGVGMGSSRQENEIKRLVNRFNELPPDKKIAYRCPEELAERTVVPYYYLNLFSRSLSAFSSDRRGAPKALADALDNMVKAEVLEKFGAADLQRFGTRSPLYFPGPAWKDA